MSLGNTLTCLEKIQELCKSNALVEGKYIFMSEKSVHLSFVRVMVECIFKF